MCLYSSDDTHHKAPQNHLLVYFSLTYSSVLTGVWFQNEILQTQFFIWWKGQEHIPAKSNA